MPIASTSMVISSSIMVRSRPPIRYITQPGMVGWGGGEGGGGDGGEGGGSVVKAPTALQSL